MIFQKLKDKLSIFTSFEWSTGIKDFIFTYAFFSFMGCAIFWHICNPVESIFSIMIACVISAPLVFSTEYKLSHTQLDLSKKLLIQICSYVVPVITFFLMKTKSKDLLDGFALRLGVMYFTLSLVIGANDHKKNLDVWDFSLRFFASLVHSLFYSTVLLVGLIGAHFGIEYLFKVEFNQNILVVLNTFCFIFFAGAYFLSLMKNHVYDFFKHELLQQTHRFIENFTIPLFLIYTIILYAYSGKILVTQEWPKGLVGYYVTSVGCFGIVLWCLGEPLKGEERFKSSRWFFKYFPWLTIPLLGLFAWAIKIRINEYGIVERRYFAISIGVWLGLSSLYLIISKSKKISVLLLSLAALFFIGSFGLFSAYEVSKRNQMGRLMILFEKYKLIKDGKITNAKVEISFDDQKNFSSIFEYMENNHDFSLISNFFNDVKPHNAEGAAKAMGIKFISKDWYANDYQFYHLKTIVDPTTRLEVTPMVGKIKGYFHVSLGDDKVTAIKLSNETYKMQIINAEMAVAFALDGKTVFLLAFREKLLDWLKQNKIDFGREYDDGNFSIIRMEDFSLSIDAPIPMKVYPDQFEVKKNDSDEYELSEVDLHIFLLDKK